jgi:hypothetical protein
MFATLRHINNFVQLVDNSVDLAREQTIPSGRPPLVGEVSANFLRIEGCRVVSSVVPLRKNIIHKAMTVCKGSTPKETFFYPKLSLLFSKELKFKCHNLTFVTIFHILHNKNYRNSYFPKAYCHRAS